MDWRAVAGWQREKRGKELRGPGKRGFLFLWAVVALVAALLTCGYAWAKKSVVLVVDGKEVPVQTRAWTVEKLLKGQNIALLEKDEVEPSSETPLKNGMVVTVSRAADVTITVDGGEIQARTRGRTVRDVLDEYSITTGPEDEVTPGPDAPVTPGMQARVVRIRRATVCEEAPLEFETEKQYTTKLPEGSTRVIQEGRAGTEFQTWQVTYRDNQEVARQLFSREVTVQPVNRVVMEGSGKTISRGGQNIRYSEVVNMLASAYSHTGYNTASGVYPYRGVAAVDTARIPMGARLYVEGYGFATALDRGGAIKGNRIDLFFDTNREAMRWGLKRVKVYILD